MDQQALKLLHDLLSSCVIEPNDIPNIELYMDQVTTFMDNHLNSSKRYPDDKIMTKTMINNYTKNHLLPPPNKKKYSKEHIFLLMMIYYYKNILSISDIQNLLSPLSEKYFPENAENGVSLETIFSSLIEQLNDSKHDTEVHITDLLKHSSHLFDHEPMAENDRKELSRLAFISQLSYDIYLRKLLIERLIDDSYPPEGHNKKEKKNKK